MGNSGLLNSPGWAQEAGILTDSTTQKSKIDAAQSNRREGSKKQPVTRSIMTEKDMFDHGCFLCGISASFVLLVQPVTVNLQQNSL